MSVEFFHEDEVARLNNVSARVQFGLVEKTGCEEDSEDEEFASEKLGNRILVCWMPCRHHVRSNPETIVLVNRSLMPGDVVRRSQPPGADKHSSQSPSTRQHGYCSEVHTYADVRDLFDDTVLRRVHCRHLSMCNNLYEDVGVAYRYWIGIVQNVNLCVTLLFADLSICRVINPNQYDLIDTDTRLRHADITEFYIGQVLRLYSNDLRRVKWCVLNSHTRKSMRKRQRFSRKIKALVIGCDYDSVYVDWKCSGDISSTMPQYCVNERSELNKFRPINWLDSHSVQVGDVRRLTLPSREPRVSLAAWREEETARVARLHTAAAHTVAAVSSRETHGANTVKSARKSRVTGNKRPGTTSQRQRHARSQRQTSLRRDSERQCPHSQSVCVDVHQLKSCLGYGLDSTIVEVLKTHSEVVVVWQDGVEERLSSNELIPSQYLDEYEYLPGDYVLRQSSDSAVDRAAREQEYGVVQTANHVTRTLVVDWYTSSSHCDNMQPVSCHYVPTTDCESSSQVECRREKQQLSVYDVKEHSEFRYKPGTVVCSVKRCQNHVDLQGENSDDKKSLSEQAKQEERLLEQTKEEEMSLEQTYKEEERSLEQTKEEEERLSEQTNREEEWSLEQTKQEEERLLEQTKQKEERLSEQNKEEEESSLEQTNEEEERSLEQTKKEEKSSKDMIEKSFSQEMRDAPFAGQVVGVSTTGKMKIWWTNDKITYNFPETLMRVGDYDSDSDELWESFSDSEDSGWETISDAEDEGSITQQVDQEMICNEVCNEEKPTEQVPDTQSDTLADVCMDCDSIRVNSNDRGVFSTCTEAPSSHYFYHSRTAADHPAEFSRAVAREAALLSASLPPGVSVRVFDDRMDLYSAMVIGPPNTPYADGVFLFDIQLPPAYPHSPPLLHFISQVRHQLNPNLYVDGKVCVSLLGTWFGHGSEVWDPSKSSLLQVLISIQGLILVADPYFNEAGYGKQRGRDFATENSRLYNEMVLVRLVQATVSLLSESPSVFQSDIDAHFRACSHRFIKFFDNLLSCPTLCKVQYSLLPVSDGFSISIKNTIERLRAMLIDRQYLIE